MSLDLRPLTLGELLDRSFGLYRAHFRTLVAIMALPAAFAAGSGLLMHMLPQVVNTAGGEPDFEAIALFLALLGAMAVMVLLYTISYMLAVGATTAAVSEMYLGRTVSAAAAYRDVGDRIGSLMSLMLQVMLRIGGVLVAAVAAGAITAAAIGPIAPLLAVVLVAFFAAVCSLAVGFLTLRYALSPAAVVLEPVTARQAIRRSIELTRGNLLRVLALVVFAVVIAYITAMLFQGPFMMGALMAGQDTSTAFWLNLAGALTGAAAGAISGPIMVVALALLYYDARVRHEGLDLQIMLQTLDDPSGLTVAPPPPAVLPG